MFSFPYSEIDWLDSLLLAVGLTSIARPNLNDTALRALNTSRFRYQG